MSNKANAELLDEAIVHLRAINAVLERLAAQPAAAPEAPQEGQQPCAEGCLVPPDCPPGHCYVARALAPIGRQAQVPSEAMRRALELARPYVEEATRRMYDGTGGNAQRREATRRLADIDAALSPTPAAPQGGAREPQPSEWRPIATAPKDGRPILVARHMGEFGWIRGWADWHGSGHVSGWVSRGFDPVMSNLGLAAPTHWMPLPASPTLPAGAVHQGEEKNHG